LFFLLVDLLLMNTSCKITLSRTVSVILYMTQMLLHILLLISGETENALISAASKRAHCLNHLVIITFCTDSLAP
jgi:hypothetical protein